VATSATLVVLSIVGASLIVEEEDLEDFWPYAWTHGLSMLSIMLVTIDDDKIYSVKLAGAHIIV
jgi:hypothetical protein